MIRTFHAVVIRGMLAPVEPLDLPDGSEVELTISTRPTDDDIAAFRRAAGGWTGTVDAEELIHNIYADRLMQSRSR